VEDQMKATTVDTLRVPGASLYYKVRGSGPVLLMIAGGAGDAESFNLVADHLIDHYTVVTYDRRGLSRSPPDDPDQRIEIETHSDDVHRLLAALGTAPACVLGNSIGALIGLDLALHHPEQGAGICSTPRRAQQPGAGPPRQRAWRDSSPPRSPRPAAARPAPLS
jgi:pimeloyl-ACP methyl ester carboxylesterase